MKKVIIFLMMLATYPAYAQNFNQKINTHRQHYLQEFRTNPNSPLKAEDLQHIHFFAADSTYRVEARVERIANPPVFRMPTYDGTSKEFVRYALLSFNLQGSPYQLTLYQNISLRATEEYKNYLFLPFTDMTNGTETYGGGRYIDLQSTDIVDGKVIIDFNLAYNPYCAYSTGYRCPVPPQENELPIAISAGEKNYTGDKKKKIPEKLLTASELIGTWKLTGLVDKQISENELKKTYTFTSGGKFNYSSPAGLKTGTYTLDEKTGIITVQIEREGRVRFKIEKKAEQYLIYTLDESSAPGILQKT